MQLAILRPLRTSKGMWTMLLMSGMVFTLSVDRYWVHEYQTFEVSLLPLAGTVLFLSYKTGKLITRINPRIMSFSLARLLPGRINPGNINLVGYSIPYLGPVFCLLVILCLPYMVRIEELIFRQGTSSWPEAIARSILFGALHLLTGIKVAPAIVATMTGLVLSWLYFQGGLALSIQGHLQYNLLIVGYLLVISVKQTRRWREQEG